MISSINNCPNLHLNSSIIPQKLSNLFNILYLSYLKHQILRIGTSKSQKDLLLIICPSLFLQAAEHVSLLVQVQESSSQDEKQKQCFRKPEPDEKYTSSSHMLLGSSVISARKNLTHCSFQNQKLQTILLIMAPLILG